LARRPARPARRCPERAACARSEPRLVLRRAGERVGAARLFGAAPPREAARPGRQTVGAPGGGVAAARSGSDASAGTRARGRAGQGPRRLYRAAPARKPPRPARQPLGPKPRQGWQAVGPEQRSERMRRKGRSRLKRDSRRAKRVRGSAPTTGPQCRRSEAKRGQAARPACYSLRAGVAREGKDRGVVAPATSRRPFPEIGVRAGSAPPAGMRVGSRGRWTLKRGQRQRGSVAVSAFHCCRPIRHHKSNLTKNYSSLICPENMATMQ
jgi:hypothetical protein